MAETSPKGYHLHDSYWTQPALLGPEDADDMHSLSVAVNWPHRPQDIDMLLHLGQGHIARDEIGRTISAGMSFPYGDTAAMVGMMMTHPKLQAGGLGQYLLDLITNGLDGRALRLNATRSAWKLYRASGFVETGSVVQYQGEVQAQALPKAPGIRPAQPEDLAAIGVLDGDVFGADRTQVLAHLFSVSRTYVLCLEGQVCGFAMCRQFGRGGLVGPLVAASETDAMALAGAFIAEHSGQFLRLDADIRHAQLGAFLNKVGMASYDRVTPMTLGPSFGPERASAQVYALASQALG